MALGQVTPGQNEETRTASEIINGRESNVWVAERVKKMLGDVTQRKRVRTRNQAKWEQKKPCQIWRRKWPVGVLTNDCFNLHFVKEQKT